MSGNKDEKFMKMALDLAVKAKEETYPNPMVGAVIVKNGKIIGQGFHKKAGTDHAEIVAIKDAKGKCKGAEMYVTLEPCDTYGKTPPCTKAIIAGGIKKVYIAMKDPNPLNKGKGIKKFNDNGIEVKVGILEKEAEEINRKYSKHIAQGVPYVTVKLAQSLDGKIAAGDGSSKWITRETARKYVKTIRKDYDAIMVGSNTALKDDPLLLPEGKYSRKIFRIVIDSSLRLSVNSQLINSASDKAPVIIATTSFAPKIKVDMLARIDGVDVIVIKSVEARVDLEELFLRLGKIGITSLLVEGGGELVGSLLDRNLIDEVLMFVAPKLLGGQYDSIKGKGIPNISKAVEFKDLELEKIGNDYLFKGIIKK